MKSRSRLYSGTVGWTTGQATTRKWIYAQDNTVDGTIVASTVYPGNAASPLNKLIVTDTLVRVKYLTMLVKMTKTTHNLSFVWATGANKPEFGMYGYIDGRWHGASHLGLGWASGNWNMYADAGGGWDTSNRNITGFWGLNSPFQDSQVLNNYSGAVIRIGFDTFSGKVCPLEKVGVYITAQANLTEPPNLSSEQWLFEVQFAYGF